LAGTVTRADGVFELPSEALPDTNVTLQFAYIGMEDQEILADTGNDINILMNPSEVSLDEVVVVGFDSKPQNRTKVSSGRTDGKPAEPMEGQKAFDDYIFENQNFPGNDSVFSGVKVILEFLIDKSGKPFDVKVIMIIPVDPSGRPYGKKINENQVKEFSDEAIRLLINGPRWNAASPPSHITRILINLSKN